MGGLNEGDIEQSDRRRLETIYKFFSRLDEIREQKPNTTPHSLFDSLALEGPKSNIPISSNITPSDPERFPYVSKVILWLPVADKAAGCTLLQIGPRLALRKRRPTG